MATVNWPITGMNYGVCATKLENLIRAIAGVDQARVNFATQQVMITAATSVLLALPEHLAQWGHPLKDDIVINNYRIEGISCAGCASKLEQQLNHSYHVKASVNFVTQQLHLSANRQLQELLIDSLNYTLTPVTSNEASAAQSNTASLWPIMISVVLSLPLLATMCGIELPFWQQLLPATAIQLGFGWHFYRSTWHQMLHRSANMDTLIALGTSTAYLLSIYNASQGYPHLYFETSAIVITLVSLGKRLEQRSIQRANSTLSALCNLIPSHSKVWRGNKWIAIATTEVQIGDKLLVGVNQSIPVDGTIYDGHSEVDQKLLTGEAFLVEKRIGDTLAAGAINTSGTLYMKASAVGDNTQLAKINRMVEHAQGQKASAQGLVDKISAYFVPAVIIAAIITPIIWLILGGDTEQAILASVAILVAACPCALGLATPVTIMIGCTRMARRGIFVRNIRSLEQAKNIDTVILDKTGTLTAAQLHLNHWLAMEDAHNDGEIKKAVATIQRLSDHPAASVFYHNRNDTGLCAEQVKSYIGEGMEGIVNKQHFLIGNQRLLKRFGIIIGRNIKATLQTWQIHGDSIGFVARNNDLVALYAIGNTLRTGARQAIAALKAQGITAHIITGDPYSTTQYVARDLGIDHFKALCRPEDKASYIKALQHKGHKVMMLGNGANDSAALVQADLSIAISQGTSAANEAADASLMTFNLALISDIINDATATHAKVWQNLGWAIGFNIVAIPLAAFGLLSPVIAGSAMAFSCVFVVSNALLLLKDSSNTHRQSQLTHCPYSTGKPLL